MTNISADKSRLREMVELTDAELDHVTGGDKPNASGFNGGGKKVAQLSQNPNDGPPPGAYTPGSK
jgi:hypothetical protein